MSPEEIERALNAIARELPTYIAVVAMPAAIALGIRFGAYLIRTIQESLPADQEKTKRKNTLDNYSLPYDQDIDDEKPKRQTYMTIGDDGELVEMDTPLQIAAVPSSLLVRAPSA